MYFCSVCRCGPECPCDSYGRSPLDGSEFLGDANGTFDRPCVSMDRTIGLSSQTRSGTAPFMARVLLDGAETKQVLEHDFESALYILAWVALGYKDGPPQTGDPLKDWRRGTGPTFPGTS